MAGKKRKSNAGRKPIMCDAIVHKLEEAYELGCTDVEACLHAGIGTSTLYNYCQKNPEFVERKETLKLTPEINAKRLLAQEAKSSPATARWLLERKQRGTYGEAKQLAVSVSGDVQHTHTLSKEAEECLDAAYEIVDHVQAKALTEGESEDKAHAHRQ